MKPSPTPWVCAFFCLLLAGCHEYDEGMKAAAQKAALDECAKHGLSPLVFRNLGYHVIKIECEPKAQS